MQSCCEPSITGAETVAACTLLRLKEHDARNRVRWLGMWWIGVPAPKRVELIWKEARRARKAGRRVTWKKMRAAYSKFEACGCIEVLKNWFERIWR